MKRLRRGRVLFATSISTTTDYENRTVMSTLIIIITIRFIIIISNNQILL